MSFWKVKNIDKIWTSICKHEGEVFYTVKKKEPYTYTVKEDYLLIDNNLKRGRISKDRLEKALLIENPTPSKIGGWAPSYICGIITDSRIV